MFFADTSFESKRNFATLARLGTIEAAAVQCRGTKDPTNVSDATCANNGEQTRILDVALFSLISVFAFSFPFFFPAAVTSSDDSRDLESDKGLVMSGGAESKRRLNVKIVAHSTPYRDARRAETERGDGKLLTVFNKHELNTCHIVTSQ